MVVEYFPGMVNFGSGPEKRNQAFAHVVVPMEEGRFVQELHTLRHQDLGLDFPVAGNEGW